MRFRVSVSHDGLYEICGGFSCWNRVACSIFYTLIIYYAMFIDIKQISHKKRVWYNYWIGSVPGLGGLKETKLFLPHPRVKVSIVGSLRDREVACSASDRQGSNFESCVWRTVSSQSSHHPQEVLLAQFSLYVHKGGLKPDSFHFHFELDQRWKKVQCRLLMAWSCYAGGLTFNIPLPLRNWRKHCVLFIATNELKML